MKRLLILSHSYAPALSPRAFRWHALAKHWAEGGHQVDVVTAHALGAPRIDTMDGVTVYRAGAGVAGRALARLRGLHGAGPLEASRPHGARRGRPPAPSAARLGQRAGAAVKWLHDSSWKRVYWPDYACAWIFPAFARAARLMRARQYDGLVSVSLPFSGHVVGLLLDATGRRAPVWVADAGDPFALMTETPVNNQRLYARLNHAAERVLLQRVRALAVTTPETAARYSAAFPESAHKVHVIPPLLSSIAEPAPETDHFGGHDRPDGRLRIVFLGTLFSTIRSPGTLLRLFDELRRHALGLRPELHFYGSVNDCAPFFEPYAHLLGQDLFIHGLVSRERAAAAMREADVLVNIGNRTNYQLPSKLIDYAETGKPILNLASSADDSSVVFLQRYPAGINLIAPAEGAEFRREDVDRLLAFLREGHRVDRCALEQWLASYRPPAIAAAYERLLGWRDARVVGGDQPDGAS